MGTRASFWIGNPVNLQNRKWLGCIAFDGYPEGLDGLDKIKTGEDFLDFVDKLKERDDFSEPSKGWPFPWSDNIFLTDFTYIFHKGKLLLTHYHRGFMTLDEHKKEREQGERPDELPEDVPAPSGYNPEQPDSIIIIY